MISVLPRGMTICDLHKKGVFHSCKSLDGILPPLFSVISFIHYFFNSVTYYVRYECLDAFKDLELFCKIDTGTSGDAHPIV